MESIDTELTSPIRSDIIHGANSKGKHLYEVQLCETRNVSRTPVRLALRLLEWEWAVSRGEDRGNTVHSPTVADILQAAKWNAACSGCVWAALSTR